MFIFSKFFLVFIPPPPNNKTRLNCVYMLSIQHPLETKKINTTQNKIVTWCLVNAMRPRVDYCVCVLFNCGYRPHGNYFMQN